MIPKPRDRNRHPASPSTVRFVPPPAPKTPKSAATRIRLIDAAAELFIERGYDAVSMRDIAAAADLTKGAVYGHFRSKGQLLVEAIRWLLSEREHTPEFAARVDDREHNVDLMFDDDGRRVRLLEVDAAAAARHDRDVEAGLTELYRERQEHLRATMTGTVDPEVAAWLISALSAGIAMKQATEVPFPEPERLGAAIRAAVAAL